MPNWCDNTVRIEGPVDKIYDLAVAVEAEKMLQYMVPLSDNEWSYEGACENWGTKWDVSEVVMQHEVSDGIIEASFQSAWSPPTEAFRTYLLDNPDVDIHHVYYEGGNDFCGVNGEERHELPLSTSDEWTTDPVLAEVDEVMGLREQLAYYEDEEDEQ
jgi:hypothetical protein|tara:strand:- start:904 stop:1377 length:474 start_codon:yes stop_codon:yes gene_type:complete